MEKALTFFQEFINLPLLCIIVVGGVFVTKFTKSITIIKPVYKILIASIIFSVLFYYIGDEKDRLLPQFLFTYLFATSFYELIINSILKKLGIKN